MGFQSTHPHGVRPWVRDNMPYHNNFNPRTHTGCDPSLPILCRGIRNFNPRTHTGCDYDRKAEYLEGQGFQSTHPHGVRLQPTASAGTIKVFQSTHPHGVRLDPDYDSTGLLGFQSTHPHGVRQRGCGYPCHPLHFNPRTHTGCDSPHCIKY